MYLTTLFVHSWFRWIVLVLAVLAVGLSVHGWITGRPWTDGDRKVGLLYAVSMDIQLLVGLALYLVLSPMTATAFANMGQAMKEPVLRFWAVEHLFMMVVALALAHLGAVLSRRKEGVARFRTAAICYGLSVLAVVAAIPWPMRDVARPLFRIP